MAARAQTDPKTPDAQQDPTQTPEAQQNPTQTPEGDAPEKVKPRRYTGPAVGSFASAPLYGTIDATGAVTPTSNGGKSEPKPGERGTMIVAKGDVITRSIARVLGAEV